MICRSCGSSELKSILDLGKMPLVNNLLFHPSQSCDLYPLEVLFCKTCDLGQLRDAVPAGKMFSEYLFYSSVQAPVLKRAQELAAQIMCEHRPSFVLEIGSNDGYLLSTYKDAGVSVLGIDPARGPANLAARKGIPTIQDFFSLDLARNLPKADVVHANNVLAHCGDINDVVAGFSELLNENGVCIVEVPYIVDLARHCQFDTVYHEHAFYFSKKALARLFNRCGLRIKRIDYLPDVLGGSLRVLAHKGEYQCEVNDEGFDDELFSLQLRAEARARDLKCRLIESKRKGNNIWGFGAAAKATVILNYAGIDSGLISAIADDTPAKQGKYIPGCGIKVRSTEEWLEAQPENTCLFIWNYAQEITQRYADEIGGKLYRGKFIPSLRTNLAAEEAATVGA